MLFVNVYFSSILSVLSHWAYYGYKHWLEALLPPPIYIYIYRERERERERERLMNEKVVEVEERV
jgi:hypothetical protein